MTTPQHNPSADEGLVEAMARAICQSDEQNGGAPWDWYGSDKARSNYFDAARAALAAARSHGGM